MVEKWSTKGVTLAFEHYEALGHQVIGFIPDYHLQYENTGKQKAAQVGFNLPAHTLLCGCSAVVFLCHSLCKPQAGVRVASEPRNWWQVAKAG